MNRIMLSTFAGALACAAMLSTAHAADLIVDSAAPVAEAAATSMYGKVFGGVALEGALDYDGLNYDMDTGWIVGAALGADLMPGLSAELEVTGSSALYSNTDNSLDALTVMGNLVYTVPLNDTFALYGGVGVGAAWVSYNYDGNDSYDADGVGAAGQVFGGIEAEIADGVSLFTEARYQSAFSDVSITDDSGSYDVEFNRTSVLAGLKLSF